MTASAATVIVAAAVSIAGGSAPASAARAPTEIPPYDGKLHAEGQKATPEGGKAVLYSRNRYGNYSLASFDFNMGLRDDDKRVGNFVNLVFGNRKRENAFKGQPIDSVPGAFGPLAQGPGGTGGHGGGPGGSRNEGGGAGGRGIAGVAGMGGANPAASHDEFQVNCYNITANRIVDLGKVDYAKVTIPEDLRVPPTADARIPDQLDSVPVGVNHVYMIHVYTPGGRPLPQDFYVKLRVLQHRDNDAVEFEWAKLPRTEREKRQ
jgi:hypothetical protein